MLSDFIWPFVKKIFPWTLLLMFIAFGIAIMTGGTINPSETGQIGDSYLYVYERAGMQYYEFKVNEYLNGLNCADIFQRWTKIGENFKMTWDNMTEHFDWGHKTFESLGNAIIMIPNMLMNIVNTIVILPTQLITQLLTVILRLLGQQINANSTFWLGKVLYNINTWTGIPQIPYIPV